MNTWTDRRTRLPEFLARGKKNWSQFWTPKKRGTTLYSFGVSLHLKATIFSKKLKAKNFIPTSENMNFCLHVQPEN